MCSFNVLPLRQSKVGVHQPTALPWNRAANDWLNMSSPVMSVYSCRNMSLGRYPLRESIMGNTVRVLFPKGDRGKSSFLVWELGGALPYHPLNLLESPQWLLEGW